MYLENMYPTSVCPIGYDFGDTFLTIGALSVALRLSTKANIYCPSRPHVEIEQQEDAVTLRASSLWAAGGQIESPGSLALYVRQTRDGHFHITGRGTHPDEACTSLVLLIRGIDVTAFMAESAHLPSFVFNGTPGRIRPLVYPSSEATMPLVFAETSDDEFFILSKDTRVRRKAFAAFDDALGGQRTIVLAHDADAREYGSEIELPEWCVGLLGDACTRADIVRERCSDLERFLGASPLPARANGLDWLKSTQLVANLHGQHWTGHVFNTFEQMTEHVRRICDHIEGQRVIAFLPAWDGRYYVTYPEHQPAVALGGADGLKRFVDSAHEMGVRVVLMLGGANLGNYGFLEKNNLTAATLKNAAGQPQVQDWVDWNGDLSPENMGYLMNFGHPYFQSYMVESASALIRDFGVDGIFLDGTLRWENAPDYSPFEGLASWALEMRSRHPECLLWGEDGYDAVWGMLDMFSARHGPLGLENFLLRYARQAYYLSLPAANGSGGVHEEGWYSDRPAVARPAWTIPTISLIHNESSALPTPIIEIIKSAARWTQASTPIQD